MLTLGAPHRYATLDARLHPLASRLTPTPYPQPLRLLAATAIAAMPHPAFIAQPLPLASAYDRPAAPLSPRVAPRTARFRMAHSSYKYVIVGAGNAAGYAARQFAELGVAPGELCLIGAEHVAPYERPALSKAVLFNRKVRLPGFHTCVGGGGERQAPEWYEQNGIKMHLGSPVTEFDAKGKAVVLHDGDTISATDAMILATGADPIKLTRTEGHDLKGIHYLRNNAEALSLFDALQENVGKTVIIVGGGYIGMEVAAAAVNVGCKVKMIFPEEHIMPRLFTPEIASYYEKVYQDKGVELINKGRLCKSFLGDSTGQVRGVMTCREGHDDAEVDGSLVVVGVGARPTTSLYANQIDMDERGGILVDGTLQTSAEGIYAVGDIATFPLKMYSDRPARMEHVQNARDSAAHAVKAIVSSSTEAYDYLPYFYSRVFDLSWQFFGDNVGDCIVVGDFDPQLLAIWVLPDGSVKGVFMESPSADDTTNMKMIAREGATVNIEDFKKCGSVQAAWSLLL